MSDKRCLLRPMEKQKKKKAQKRYRKISRRDFLKFSGTVTIGAGLVNLLPRLIWLDDAIAAIPSAEGYLLVDTKKCQGCLSCMLACSLVHEGKENLSLARIQVLQNAFGKFPDDLTLAQCRQCIDPACVKACPQEALHVDTEKGNIRRVEKKKCTGCKACIQACPYEPCRAVWNLEEKHAQVCDLCLKAPFWTIKGGPNGKQACVEVCPLSAIKFTKEIPVQKGDDGYKANLRGAGWRRLGYPTD